VTSNPDFKVMVLFNVE